MTFEDLVVEEMYRESDRAKAKYRLGELMCIAPENQNIVLDYTAAMGACSNLYYSFVFQLPKWGWKVKKVDEYMEVTPTHADTYNLTIAQKQKLMGEIKSGLASAGQAVADYELAKHDLRRYEEIIDYFRTAHKEKDDHVLRYMFIDRVDAHIGEPFSLISMAKRWPTIITDFTRLSDEDDTVDKIRKKLDVPASEATVLKTKNDLYKEWKKLFFPAVKERYARIKTLVKSREKSIEEYRRWLKPYVTRYKMMREMGESDIGKTGLLNDPYMTPGFGQAVAYTGIRLWVWKVFHPPEMHRPEKKKYGKFWVEPYDHVAKEWKKRIEDRYGVELTEKDIEDVINSATATEHYDKLPAMDPDEMYYILWDIKVMRSIIKTPPPKGGEIENIMFWPIKLFVVSQNVLMIHLMELKARTKAFEKSINELIGSSEAEKEEMDILEKEFAKAEKEEKERLDALKKAKSFGEGVKKIIGWIPSARIKRWFIKPGPYESNLAERITKIYLVTSGGIYGEMIDFLKSKMGVR